MIKQLTLNTSYLLCVRLHVSVLMWPSSGLLTNQVNKCWLHVGIPTMFTDREGFCWYEFNVQQSTEMPLLDFSFRIHNLLSQTSSSHLPAWSLLDHKRKRHVQPLKWKRYFFAKPSTRYLPVIYNRRNHGGTQQRMWRHILQFSQKTNKMQNNPGLDSCSDQTSACCSAILLISSFHRALLQSVTFISRLIHSSIQNVYVKIYVV